MTPTKLTVSSAHDWSPMPAANKMAFWSCYSRILSLYSRHRWYCIPLLTSTTSIFRTVQRGPFQSKFKKNSFLFLYHFYHLNFKCFFNCFCMHTYYYGDKIVLNCMVNQQTLFYFIVGQLSFWNTFYLLDASLVFLYFSFMFYFM